MTLEYICVIYETPPSCTFLPLSCRAMCVTCGAWLALTLWEALLYMPHGSNSHGKSVIESEVTIDRVLTIFRGIVQFFVDYLWLDHRTGIYHSGNSLEI